MVANRWRKIGPVVGFLTLASVPLLVDCGGLPKVPGMPGLPGSCPADITNPDAIMSANFGLKGDVEGKLKAALAAGANLQKVAAGVQADVVTACGNLAKDLGASASDVSSKDPQKVCGVAVKLINSLKAKASGSLKVNVVPPKCSASMSAMADCAAKCDASVKPGSAQVKCEGGEISGSCSGQCSGSCTVEAGAQCSGSCGGSCSGKCQGNFTGKCDGKCQGKCDGKNSHGSCAGTCDGTCTGNASGSCSGTCSGSCSASCTMQGKADCKGTCSGGCSVKMKEPQCSGKIVPPKMSADCKANCNAKVSGKVDCIPARVTVEIAGAADAQAATTLKVALEKNLPAILKVTLGLKGRLEDAVASVKTSVEGIKAVVSGAGAGALKVAGCIAGAVKGEVAASASINVSVKASASASGSAGAG
jgi:hypothetical protein